MTYLHSRFARASALTLALAGFIGAPGTVIAQPALLAQLIQQAPTATDNAPRSPAAPAASTPAVESPANRPGGASAPQPNAANRGVSGPGTPQDPGARQGGIRGENGGRVAQPGMIRQRGAETRPDQRMNNRETQRARGNEYNGQREYGRRGDRVYRGGRAVRSGGFFVMGPRIAANRGWCRGLHRGYHWAPRIGWHRATHRGLFRC